MGRVIAMSELIGKKFTYKGEEYLILDIVRDELTHKEFLECQKVDTNEYYPFTYNMIIQAGGFIG